MPEHPEHNWAPPVQGLVSQDPTEVGVTFPLFRKPFITDWTVVLGLLGVAVGVGNALSSYPSLFNNSASYDYVAATLDVLFALIFQFAFLAFLPAAIRLKVKKSRARKGKPPKRAAEEFSVGRAWLLAALVAILVGVGVELSKTSGSTLSGKPASSYNAALPRECRPNGSDTICIQTVQTGPDASFDFDWTYLSDKEFNGSWVHKWRWTIHLNCQTHSGYVTGIVAEDRAGNRIAIDSASRRELRAGFQSTYVTAMLAEC